MKSEKEIMERVRILLETASDSDHVDQKHGYIERANELLWVLADD